MSKIGIDIGTTNVKAILFDEVNQIIRKESININTHYNEKGFAEQSVQEVLEATLKCLNMLVDEKVEYVSFSSAMHSLIIANKVKQPFTENIIWADNRAKDAIDKFKEHLDWLSFYQKTGTPIHPMSPFAKLLWFKLMGILESDMFIFGMKEYIIYQLTGEYVMDYSIASATGLMNLDTLEWDEDILDFLQISKEMLPRLVDTNTELQAKDFHYKVVVGASDGCLVNLGSNALNKGQTTLTIGTSGAVRMTVDQPILDQHGRTFCYYLKKDTYIIGGAVNNGGNVLDWLGNVFFDKKEELLKALPTYLRETEMGANGLIFLPHLFGERAPYWDASLSAMFYGIKVYHHRAQFVRAVVEGLFYNLKHVLEILEGIGGASTELFISGGVLESEEMLQTVADIFNLKLHVQPQQESTCLGAILLKENKDVKLEEKTIVPKQAKAYDASYELFRQLSYGLDQSEK